MDGELLANRVLENLQPQDLELLLNLNFRRAFDRGEVVVAAGENVDRFYVVEEGVLRVDAPEGPRYLRRGQVIGSTSVLVQRPAVHGVVAQEDVITVSLTPRDIDWLIEAEPETAARVLRMLAAALAARNVSAPVGAGATPEPPEGAAELSGLAKLAEACREAQQELAAMGPAPEEGQAYWARERISHTASIYRPVLRSLAAFVEQGAPDEREQRVHAARRELMNVAGSSRLVERMHTRPEGQPVGYRGFNHIYRNVPEGDDILGLLTDAWLLTRPFSEAIRERRTIANQDVNREILDRARPDRVVRILSLGCGPARSLADLLEEPGLADKISVMCVDDDQEALVHANNLLKGRAPRGDITFRQSSPADLTPDAEGFGGYDLVASLYTADNADAAALGRILYTAHRWLHAYGTLQLVVFGDAVPDWLLLEVLLDWKPMRHSQRELQDIVARSPFNQSNADVGATPSGLNLFLRATK